MKRIANIVFLFLLAFSACSCAKSRGSNSSQAVITRQPDIIDISHHNVVCWDQIPSSVKGVYIKATTGSTHVDELYAEHLKMAKKHHLKIGSYHFLTSQSSVTEQFDNFSRIAKKSDQDLIPMLDVEEIELKHWSVAQIQDSIQKFIDLCKAYYGKAPMIYGTMRSYNTYCAPRFNHYHAMIGRYGSNVPQLKGNGAYTLWQYTDKFNIGGHHIDGSIFNSKYSLNDILLKSQRAKK